MVECECGEGHDVIERQKTKNRGCSTRKHISDDVAPVVELKSRLSGREIEKSNFAFYRSIGYGIKVGCWRVPRRVWPGVRVSQKKL